jgi:hypothetical protein
MHARDVYLRFYLKKLFLFFLLINQLTIFKIQTYVSY